MIDRENVLKNHAVHTSLIDVKEKVESLLDNFLDNISYGHIINRCKLVLSMIIDVLDNGNLELVRLEWLDAINSICANIRNHSVNFESTENLSYIDNIDTCTDELLEYVFRLNSVNNMPVDVNEAYRQYVETYHQRVKDLISCIEETENELNTIKEAVAESKTISESNLAELSNKIVQEQQRLDSFATAYQKQMNDDKESFSQLKISLSQQFADNTKTWDDKVSALIENGNSLQDEFNNSADEQFEIFNQEKNNIIQKYSSSFEHFEDEVRNMVGIINANTFSSKYREVADDAKSRASLWHKIAIGAMICVAAFAVYAFVCTTNNDTGWVKLVAKIFATGTLATIAAYAVNEASKQEKVERYARKIEMELVSIDPFIESLQEEKKTEIKQIVAEKIFNSPDDMGISRRDDFNVKQRHNNSELMKIIEAMLKNNS